MTVTKHHHLRNILLITLAAILVTAGGTAFWLKANYKHLLLQKLPELSAKATGSTYKIKAGNISIYLPGKRLVFT